MSLQCILDCDPGHDDAVAILLAAASPALDLRAITTVAGNGTLDKVTHNARAVCTLAGIRNVPIAAGADRPLRRPLEIAAHVHGDSALDGPALPAPGVPLDERPAVRLMADVLDAADEPVTLIPTGPLTNVAACSRRTPTWCANACARSSSWAAPPGAATTRRTRSSTSTSIPRRPNGSSPPGSR